MPKPDQAAILEQMTDNVASLFVYITQLEAENRRLEDQVQVLEAKVRVLESEAGDGNFFKATNVGEMG